MADALARLDGRDDCRVVSVSKLYRTPPWGKTDQADFLNCCALIETRLAPQPLLELCLSIEREMKRVRIERWGPRTIDIDILTYDDQDVSTETLAIPHPRITERAFVLVPLADIAPELDIAGKSVRDWTSIVDAGGIEAASADGGWWRSNE
ncbi:2-amino-4-hydroxy-6-hydroxymethyldihydropteridine diphosphokinase [Ciceribacter sp. L1K23]|nr:2-amino-4-hydroxy-6-hydroxymethyldihydropteridine diphosphokinase [Ciceribacter sp. L1K22]MBR0555275.1 2-amino-4-hydroxy-6-hydroxymethyldihydropteridine diphosphokinase [Ciceribacter sp. L1K23]